MGTTRPTFGGLLKEALVIFAGVLVALVADDWRQSRLEKAEADLSLRVILDDLRRDSTMAAQTRISAGAHLSAAQWIFDQRDVADPDPDSINSALLALESFTRPVFSGAGYEGLRASNRLGLVGSESLRSALVAYYEVDQPRFASYSEIVYGRREAMLEVLARSVEYGSFPPAGPEVSLAGGWRDFVAQPGMLTRLRRYGGSVGAMLSQFDQLDRTLIELIQRLDTELNPGG